MIMISPLKAQQLLLIVFLAVEPTQESYSEKVPTLSTKISFLKRPQFATLLSGNVSSSKICSNDFLEQNHTCSGSVQSCPTWFICNDTQSGKCQCGPVYHNAIKCYEKRMISTVLNCYCVTEANGETYAGLCFYNCERAVHNGEYQNVYHDISNKTNLNEVMCGRFSRTGILCGECKEGLSPFVLSYNLSCVECPGGHKNWWKFVLVGFVPLTFFYFFVVFFNLSLIHI